MEQEFSKQRHGRVFRNPKDQRMPLFLIHIVCKLSKMSHLILGEKIPIVYIFSDFLKSFIELKSLNFFKVYKREQRIRKFGKARKAKIRQKRKKKMVKLRLNE